MSIDFLLAQALAQKKIVFVIKNVKAMKYLYLIIVLIWSFAATAQELTPEKLGLEAGVIKDKQLGQINYYLTKNEEKTKKPLLIYLDGSGFLPLFQKMGQGVGSVVALDLKELQKEYRVLLISKPDIPFIDEVTMTSHGYPDYQAPAGYHKKLSLDWRVNSTDLIINKLVKDDEIDITKVVVLGLSEGAQVGPYIAQKNKYVSHLMLFAGNGLNQFFDFIINARLKSQRGEFTEQEAQTEIDSLFQVYDTIYNAPKNTDKFWYGHTYQRWASFTNHDPVDALIELDIPIYITNGSLDENSVLSADYIYLDFLRKRKTNLTYKTYPNYDHQFNELIFEDGKVTGATPKLNDALQDAFDWLEKH